MMKTLALYSRYALRSFMRGRSRSFFGAFCVAVGVASVVALGLVGANFQHTISSNGQKINRGDLSVNPAAMNGFTARQYAYFAQLKARGEIVDYTTRLQTGAQIRKPGNSGDNLLARMTGVDPTKFPFYDQINATDPSGKPLAALLASPADAAVGQSTYDKLHLRVGAPIAVDTPDGTFHYAVTGIVPNTAPDPSTTPFSSDLVMVNSASLVNSFAKQGIAAGTVYVKTAGVAQALRVKRELIRRLGDFNITVTTASDAAKNARANPKTFDRFFRLMGLVAVVIGGIGIINTMLVAARRRTREIAVLKAVGMKSRQVVLVFMMESLILGAIGTAVGMLLGIGASVEVTQATGGITGASIPWSLDVPALASGAVIGILATVVFACMPVIRASGSRPVAALRSDAARMSKLGWRRSVALVVGLAALSGIGAVLYTGLASGTRAIEIGAIAGIGALVAGALLTRVFIGVVWLISKSPSMGRLSVRMALRNMGTQRSRLGSTLLALFIGMLALGVVSIVSESLKASGDAYITKLNTNVFIQAHEDAASRQAVNRELSRLQGIQHRDDGAYDTAITLTSVNGMSAGALLYQALNARDPSGHSKFARDDVVQAAGMASGGIEAHDPRTFDNYLTMAAGRTLSTQDIGTDHVVVAAKLAKVLGFGVGARLGFSEGSRTIPFTVVGVITDKALLVDNQTMADLRYLQRMGLTTPGPKHFVFISLMIAKSLLKSDITALQRRLPHAVVVDVSSFSSQIGDFVDKLALLPEVIAILCLAAGGVIIANTVALGMIERRNEFGVMKAVGARRRSILQFLAVEHAVIGFIGGATGVVVAMLAAGYVDRSALYMTTSYDWRTLGGLVLLGIALALGASALTAYPASSEKPLRALRHE
jgi:predicted lysophospholipase L1 biosynthesis ABC-type transport system permease subunit